MSDLTLAGPELVLGLVNEANSPPVLLSTDNVTLGSPSTGSGDKNTNLTLTGKASGPYSGDQTVHYNRLDIGDLFTGWSLSPALAAGASFSVASDLLPSLNARYQLNLNTDDIVNEALDFSSYPASYTLVMNASSYGYTGSLPITVSLSTNTLASLYAQGEDGFWYDPSDLSTLFQDTSGTQPVTAVGQTVQLVKDKSGNGRDMTGTATLQSENGLSYLSFNGSSNGFEAPGLQSTTLQRHLSVGFFPNNITTPQMLLELGPNTNAAPFGAFFYVIDSGPLTFGSKALAGNSDSSTYQQVLWSIGAAPVIAQLQHDRTNPNVGGQAQTYINGSLANATVSLNHNLQNVAFPAAIQHYIGARGESSSFLNGRLYGLVYLDRLATAGELSTIHAYLQTHMPPP